MLPTPRHSKLYLNNLDAINTVIIRGWGVTGERDDPGVSVGRERRAGGDMEAGVCWIMLNWPLMRCGMTCWGMRYRGAGHMLGAFWGVLGCSYDLFRDFEVKEKT